LPKLSFFSCGEVSTARRIIATLDCVEHARGVVSRGIDSVTTILSLKPERRKSHLQSLSEGKVVCRLFCENWR
jgi:hypothetical protein